MLVVIGLMSTFAASASGTTPIKTPFQTGQLASGNGNVFSMSGLTEIVSTGSPGSPVMSDGWLKRLGSRSAVWASGEPMNRHRR